MGKVIITFFCILLVVIFGFLIYYNFFINIKVSVIQTGGEYVVYENITGSYKNTSKINDEIYYSLLNNEKIETYKGFGIFYDNPSKVKEEDLRSEAGCIIEKKDEDKIEELEKKYKIKKIPYGDYIVAEFPIKGNLSYIIGAIKVNKKLNSFTEKNGFNTNSPIMEIYDIPNKVIIYRKEVINKKNID